MNNLAIAEIGLVVVGLIIEMRCVIHHNFVSVINILLVLHHQVKIYYKQYDFIFLVKPYDTNCVYWKV